MTSVLVITIAMGLIQLGLALHVRNTLISCAAEGARLGAREGSTPQEGVARTESMIAASLSPRYAESVTAHVETTADGVEVVVVEVSAPLPVIGLVGPTGGLDVRGRAFDERQ